ncbi:MgtE-domain-containing protein [Hesseltinella vesiculosa]|uniref:MgtE-domain-containing protein n=1 Tax=Hesseltinella vesiculosa TaxID=101127 RepID=A0A1X2GN01_9FUNG|nr:MgtE-domain-containing protein [Hesseltinella vesiculosa]
MSSYTLANTTEHIELRPRQVEEGLRPIRQHKRSSSSTSFIHFKTPAIPPDPIDDESPLDDGHRLATQALPSLLISVVGLVLAGWMMDTFQHWQVFEQVSELFILVPVLLNLKGNLEMNLAARFSTSANLGDLDLPQKRNALIWGNLALIQVQALISGAVAGMVSLVLGWLEHPSDLTISNTLVVTASSIIAATGSSFVLGVFMCLLIIASRKLEIDPDNIACPMASSLGDVVTLGILAASAHTLMNYSDSSLSLMVILAMIASIPFFARAVWQNKHVKDLLLSGWSPIMIAMLISSLAGLVLERFVEKYKGLAMLTPIVCGLTGNLGSIYASRISTSLHAGRKDDQKHVEWTLLLMNVPVQCLFLCVIWWLDLGHLDFTFAFALTYFIVATTCTFAALKMGRFMTFLFWKQGYDPDNYVLPYLTAMIDVLCTSLLVFSCWYLASNGLADLATFDIKEN